MAVVNNLAKELYKEHYATFKTHVGDENGCTGKSTAQALKLIAEAIDNPGKAVKLTEGKSPIVESRTGGFLDLVLKLISKMELRFLSLSHKDATLTYNLFEESPSDILELLNKELESAVKRRDYVAVESLSKSIQRIKN